MKNLHYSMEGFYTGTTSDNRVIRIEAIEVAEAEQKFLNEKALAMGLSSSEDLSDTLRTQLIEGEFQPEIDDPNMWAALVGENQNVEFV